MTDFINADSFMFILGLAQVVLAVFGIFVLGLLIKILSDLSDITGQVKTELNTTLVDFSALRAETKKTGAALIKAVAVIASTIGVKKLISFLDGLTRKPVQTKKKNSKSNRVRQVVVKSE